MSGCIILFILRSSCQKGPSRNFLRSAGYLRTALLRGINYCVHTIVVEDFARITHLPDHALTPLLPRSLHRNRAVQVGRRNEVMAGGQLGIYRTDVTAEQ